MRSANSHSIDSEEAIVLHLLDWWTGFKVGRVREAISTSSPDDCESVNMETVGFHILKQWPDWQKEFLESVRGDSFAEYLWGQTQRCRIRRMDAKNQFGWEKEFAGRIGTAAKDWIIKHRKRIEKNQIQMRAVRHVQNT